MPFFYKSYKKCFLATALSFTGGCCGAIAVITLIQVILGRGDFTRSEGLISCVVCAVLFFALRKLADVVAARKYRKMAAKEAAGSNERR